MKYPKPKGCPGTYHWLACRYCKNRLECGLKAVETFTWKQDVKAQMRAALEEEVPAK